MSREASAVSHEKIAQCKTVLAPAAMPSHGIHCRARAASDGGKLGHGEDGAEDRPLGQTRKDEVRADEHHRRREVRDRQHGERRDERAPAPRDGAPDRRSIHAMRVDHAMTPTVTQSTT